MSEKIKIEISQEIFDKIKRQYENGIEAYTKLNIQSVEHFISYILENFANSTTQFDKLSDQMKKMIENIDLENLNFENIFKNIAESSAKKPNINVKENLDESKVDDQNKEKNNSKKS